MLRVTSSAVKDVAALLMHGESDNSAAGAAELDGDSQDSGHHEVQAVREPQFVQRLAGNKI